MFPSPGSRVGRRRITIANSVTTKQLRAWAAANGSPLYIYTIDSAMPADIASAVNIRWLNAGTMVFNDPLYSFIQITLSFTSAQMAAAFGSMQTYPA